MRLLGVAPRGLFSGFETSFFEALVEHGALVDPIIVDVPWYRLWCTATSMRLSKKRWALQRDLEYNISSFAYRIKSAHAQRAIHHVKEDYDAIYQVGSLWNPISRWQNKPFFMQVDYTSLLSEKRRGEWKRRTPRERGFWIDREIDLYSRARAILTTTANARHSIVQDYGIPEEKVITVGAGVSSPYDTIEAERLPAYDSKAMLFVGKGYYGKGLDTILDALVKVRAQLSDAQLTIVGPTDFRSTLKGISYLGRIADREKVKDLYYKHACFVMPSRNEPVGQVFLEAMSCALPCIGSTVDAMPELITEGQTGYLVEPGDGDSLAQALLMVLSNPDLAQSLGRAGRRKVMENHTWAIVGKRIYDTIAHRLEEST